MIFLWSLLALLHTFLVSRLVLWLLKNWLGGYLRVVLAHSLLVALTVAGWIATLGSFDPVRNEDLALYVAAQASWLTVDLFAYRGRIANARGSI